ncbi:MAG TPA: hypothetical protein VK013_14530 [Myxococcaceae bacterium]|nr:hypothetical protein [Myxococcaceae bacterium]
MAFDGELVRMENGRWARFQQCRILNAGHPDHEGPTILVAVELEDSLQSALDAAQASVESYRRRGIPVRVQLDDASPGRVNVEVLSQAASAGVH